MAVAGLKLTPLFVPAGPVAAAFGVSRAVFKSIMGPVGSAKTTECIATAIRVGGMQEAVWNDRRGCFVKKCRGAVVRDTYPNLDRTVIKSWHKWFPEELGKWKWDAPRSHRFVLYMNGRKGDAGYYELDMEVLFVAIGDHAVEDVLRGLELTWLWPNEMDLLLRAIIEYGIGRVGRYPSGGDGRCLFPQIFGDFNAPEEDNWTVETVIERKIDPELMKAIEEAFGGNDNPRPIIEFFRQPGGLEEGAENLHNLEGGRRYYVMQAALLSPDKKRRLIDNRIGPIRHGTPVYPEFIDDCLYDQGGAPITGHVRPFELRRELPILIGADQDICPGAIFAQLWPEFDQLVWFDEMARIFEGEDGHIEVSQMGGEAFGEQCAARVLTRYPGFEIGLVVCDPAGSAGEQAIGHTSWRKAFQKGLGAHVKRCAVPGNSIEMRTKAVRDRLGAKVPGKPRLLVHPRMTLTRKAFNSRYVWQRVGVGGEGSGKFGSSPVKVQGFSDLMNAGEYLAWELRNGLSFGAVGAAAPRATRRPITNDSDYSMFGRRA